MGFFKSIASVVAAPFTVPAKIASNVIDQVAKTTGLDDIPVLGNVLSGASSALSLGDSVRTGKSSDQIKSEAKDAVILGATIISGGSLAPVLVASATYGGDVLSGVVGKTPPGLLETVGAGLGIPPGVLSSFLPSQNSRIPYSGGDSGGGGYVPATQAVEYGVESAKPNIFPVVAVAGGLLVLTLALKKRR